MDSFSGTLGKSSKSGTMVKLTFNLRYVTLKSNEGVLRYHENHGAFRCIFLHRKSQTIFDRPQWCWAQGRTEPENRFSRVLCRSRGPTPRRHARHRTQVYIPVYQTHNFWCCSLFPLIEFSAPLFLWSTEGSGRFQVNSFPPPHLPLYPNWCSSIFSLSLIFAGSYCVAASRQVMHHIYCALRFTRHLPRSILELNFTFKYIFLYCLFSLHHCSILISQWRKTISQETEKAPEAQIVFVFTFLCLLGNAQKRSILWTLFKSLSLVLNPTLKSANCTLARWERDYVCWSATRYRSFLDDDIIWSKYT